MSGQHPFFDPSFSAHSQQEREAQRAAQDAAIVLGQDYVNQQLQASQIQGQPAQFIAAQQAAAEAAYVRGMYARRMMGGGAPQATSSTSATATPMPSAASAQPPQPAVAIDPEEFKRQVAERRRRAVQQKRDEALAREEARHRAQWRVSNRAIEGLCTLLLIVGFIPAFIATFGSGPAFNPLVGILYLVVLGVFFKVKSP